MMMRRELLAGLAALPFAPRAAPGETVGSITRFDPELDELIDVASPIEVIAVGFRWAEGPVWVERGKYLLFSDVPANIVYRWKAGEGARPFLDPSGLSGPIPAGIREAGANGLTLDGRDTLLMADSGTRAIARVELATRRKTILADSYRGRRFNSCNDVAIARGGTIYFTDPPYGLSAGDASPLKELGFNGVYRMRSDGSGLALVERRLTRPNGIALSPAEDRLYVSNSDPADPRIFACPLAPDGSAVGDPVPFADFSAEVARKLPGLPDGLKVSPSGHVFATSPGGIHILSPQGRRLGLIATGKAIANCCFGENGRSLFMTSSDMVARVRLRA
ncbi:SMP-30/gluconolactonase/LRE family protein [Sphingomonas sp.]|uniref:SMP-30/gluconolactonase/LRE family protein n=1 Tax=Sphingomonas sp. TaxID=28214 RepID=UPI0031DA1F7D